jgi:poly-gamma-glutamate synthesis protein (capsule biosynthesis protein)
MSMLQAADPRLVTLFLCGDVMTGRGIDQILPHPSDPQLFESWVRDARDYVALAEEKNGPIDRPVDFAYIWGDALGELDRVAPDVSVINLETSITRSDAHWPRKGIHYRMHPRNIASLRAANIDCCVLANNHVLDWGIEGLEETLTSLAAANVAVAGTGVDLSAARAPALLDHGAGGRVLVFAMGTASAGIPPQWAARGDRPGIHYLDGLGPNQVQKLALQVNAIKRPGDIAVASIHWGGNWGYPVAEERREFAHQLVDGAGIDVVHGHSSHHPLGLEIYRERLVMYGCGDFINDYEGIRGHETFRGDLALMYFPRIDSVTGALIELSLIPMQREKLTLRRAAESDVLWLAETLDRESRKFATRVRRASDGALRVVAI